MKIVKEMNKIVLKLVGIAMVMMAMLLIGRIEVKAEEPNYLTFEALEDGSEVGLYIVDVEDSHYVAYQKFDGSDWESTWHSDVSINDPGNHTVIPLNNGQKVRFKGKNAKVYFGGTTDEQGFETWGILLEK